MLRAKTNKAKHSEKVQFMHDKQAFSAVFLTQSN